MTTTGADIMADTEREYQATHRWIAFRLEVRNAPWTLWNSIGEAHSKCQHLARTPLPPLLAKKMESVHLAKGARASTAIEGNSLSEEQAIAAVEGRLHLPESQAYLRQELGNVIGALAGIEAEVHGEGRFELTPAKIRDLNRLVLTDLELEDHVTPGEFRAGGIAVGAAYRGPPARDCEYLVGAMCEWLNGREFHAEGEDHAKDFYTPSCGPCSPISTSRGFIHLATGTAERLGWLSLAS